MPASQVNKKLNNLSFFEIILHHWLNFVKSVCSAVKTDKIFLLCDMCNELSSYAQYLDDVILNVRK